MKSIVLPITLFFFCIVTVTSVKGDSEGVDCYACVSASPDICKNPVNETKIAYMPNFNPGANKTGFDVETFAENSYLTCEDFFKGAACTNGNLEELKTVKCKWGCMTAIFDVKYRESKKTEGPSVDLSRTVRQCAGQVDEYDQKRMLEAKRGIKRTGSSDGQIMHSYYCTDSSKPCNSANKPFNSFVPIVVASILSTFTLFW